MRRILFSMLFSILVLGLASAQPPVDYALVCVDGEIETVIGTASSVDGQLHVVLVEGWTCAGTILAGGEVVEIDDGGGVTVVSFDGMSGEAIHVPDEALAGMLGAQENRAAAFANVERGKERSAAAGGGKPESLPEGAGGGRP